MLVATEFTKVVTSFQLLRVLCINNLLMSALIEGKLSSVEDYVRSSLNRMDTSIIQRLVLIKTVFYDSRSFNPASWSLESAALHARTFGGS